LENEPKINTEVVKNGFLIKKEIVFKIAISLIFGLIGFFVNFIPMNFHFPPFKATFLLGLVFPLIITLAWGWKYGLLSATLGLGCQTMWFLWLPHSGWGAFVSVPLFSLWIVWHGWCANRKKRQYTPWLSPFIVEIPYRLFNTIMLYTLFSLACQFNPAPWAPSTCAAPLIYINFIVMKEIVNAYLILLVTNVLLNLGGIRSFLKLEKRIEQIRIDYIISVFTLIGMIFWILDGFFSYFVFGGAGEGSFLDSIFLNISPHDLFIRLMFLLTSMSAGLLISKYLRKVHESEIKYSKAYNRANFYKDVFTHDINNILQSIQSSQELLSLFLKDLKGKENIYEILQIVTDQVNRGAMLVSNVKKLSEIDNKKKPLKKKEIIQILNQIIKHVNKIFLNKQLNIEINCPHEKIYVRANEFIIDVFENILSNAVEHNNKSIVDILINVSKEEKNGISRVKLEFIDNGMGIPNKRKKLIFKRADENEEESTSGRGLGLALVKKILDEFNGKVWVEDKVKGEYSKGSKFIVQIPEAL